MIITSNEKLWDSTLQELSHDFYHLPEYTALEAERMGGQAEMFIQRDEDKLFCVPYIRRDCGHLPWAGPCAADIFDVTSAYGFPAPLFSPSACNDLNFCHLSIKKWLTKLKAESVCTIFLRFHPLLNFIPSIWSDCGKLVSHGDTVTVDLNQTHHTMWGQTRQNHRRDIRKWEKNGGQIIIDTEWRFFDNFINLYHANMEHLGASQEYFFSKEYFRSLQKILGLKLHLFVALLDEQPVSAALFTEVCDIVEYYLSGTGPKFLYHHPLKAILHQARLWAKNRKNRYFHLGGGVGSKNDNLLNFKLGFSKMRTPFYTWRYILDENKYFDLCNARTKADSKFAIPSGDLKGYFPAYRR